MSLLQAQNLTKTFGVRTLFSGVSFEIFESDRIGLIGVNGCGKSTLLSLLLPDGEPDAGLVSRARDCRIGRMEQALPFTGEATLYDMAVAVFAPLMETERALAGIAGQIEAQSGDLNQLIQRQYRLQEAFERGGGLTYRSRTRATLLGLGFLEADLQKPAAVMSGGEIRKTLLARLLLADTNLLLLDEPTNHLDLRAIEWLEEFLLAYRGAFVVVSHDRYFLDRVTNRTLELVNGRLSATNGNYSRHLSLELDEHEAAQRRYDNLKREIKRIEGIIEQQRRWNQERNYVTIASKEKQIARLKKDLVKPEAPPAHIRFHFPAPATSGNEVIAARGLEKRFGERTLFSGADMLLQRGEHACLLGANGCGKTTLLKILTGQEPVDGGSFRIGANVQIGYFEQAMRRFAPEKTIFDELSDSFPRMDVQQIRNALGTFLFRGDDVQKTLGTLSGGELARIQLLKLMLSGNNLLLLDEPTNHLDIASREQLEDALNTFEGTILVVTHDRYFINRIADRILILSESGIEAFSGDWDEYLSSLANPAMAQAEAMEPERPASAYAAAKEQRGAINRAKGQMERAEAAIAAAEKEIAAMEAQMALPEIASDYVAAAKYSRELEQKQVELNGLYEQWDAADRGLRSLMEE